MKNKYEIQGDTTVIYLNKNLKTIISTKDLERVKEFPNSWSANWNKRRGVYVVIGNLPSNDPKCRPRALLTRWILNPEKGMVVDHINHDTLDNRRDNLRILTNQQNCQNRKGCNSQNRSSFLRGVSLTKNGKWAAFIGVNWKRKHLGVFNTIEEANRAVIKARKELMPYSENAMEG